MSADAFAVAQYRYAVGEWKDFLQPMRNVDDAHPAGAQFAHDAEKQMLLLLRERSRRLVHDDDARARAERAGDFDELLLRHRERAHLGIRQDLGADALKEFPGTDSALRPVYAGSDARPVRAASRCSPRP